MPGLVRQGTLGLRDTQDKKKMILSRSGLPVLPVKKVNEETILEIKQKEELTKVKEKVVNMAEERLKLKEANERKMLKEAHKRKQEIMQEIKNP
jgi:hypothetical protein